MPDELFELLLEAQGARAYAKAVVGSSNVEHYTKIFLDLKKEIRTKAAQLNLTEEETEKALDFVGSL